jgi:hypothetical protein
VYTSEFQHAMCHCLREVHDVSRQRGHVAASSLAVEESATIFASKSLHIRLRLCHSRPDVSSSPRDAVSHMG